MRITYRWTDNNAYWTKRWDDIPADHPMENLDVYPLKYAEMTIKSRDGKILEAGCGAGRILRYYADRGYDITGIDFIEGAVNKLKKIDPELKVETGDITGLGYADRSFRYLLAFGLYHNLPEAYLGKAVAETYRVVEPGGRVCASFRADNMQTLLTDWLTERKSQKNGMKSKPTEFHKMNLTKREFVDLFEKAGFKVLEVYPVVNMPVFYKFSFFRDARHKFFNENLGRKEGYRLSFLGEMLQRFLMKFFPEKVCSIFVLIAERPKSK